MSDNTHDPYWEEQVDRRVATAQPGTVRFAHGTTGQHDPQTRVGAHRGLQPPIPPQVRGDYAQVIQPSIARTETMRVWGSRYAHLVFERCGRNKRRACRVLGISYHTLDAYLRYACGKRAGARKQLPAWVTASAATTDPQQPKE